MGAGLPADPLTRPLQSGVWSLTDWYVYSATVTHSWIPLHVYVDLKI